MLIVASLGTLTACSIQPPSGNHSESVTPSPTPAAPTADALEAKRVVHRYFELMRARDFTQAWALWSDSSKASAGGLKAFVAASEAQGRFDGRAGLPSAVRDDGMTRYVLVETAARVTSPKGRVTDQSGVVMLKRPVADGAPWQIWGVDVRPRHCRKGEVARGLGCVSV